MNDPEPAGSHGKPHRTTKILNDARQRGGVAARGASAINVACGAPLVMLNNPSVSTPPRWEPKWTSSRSCALLSWEGRSACRFGASPKTGAYAARRLAFERVETVSPHPRQANWRCSGIEDAADDDAISENVEIGILPFARPA